jgi:hypothetical protein
LIEHELTPTPKALDKLISEKHSKRARHVGEHVYALAIGVLELT